MTTVDDQDEYEEDFGDEEIEAFLGTLLDPQEVRAGGAKRSLFTRDDVMLMSRRLDVAGVLPQFEKWRSDDAAGRYRGGRKPLLDDRAIMICWMLLRSEGSPSWISELGLIFWLRLTDDAREALGIAHLVDTGNDELDQRAWYERARNGLLRIVKLFDAWPARRGLHNREQREEALSLRDRNTERRMQERSIWFAGAMLTMTFYVQPRRWRRKWKGALTTDQTAAKAHSAKGRRARDKQTKKELAIYNPTTGEEIHKLVLEIDAEWYPKNGTGAPRISPDGKPEQSYEWDWMLSLVAQTTDRHDEDDAGHPMLILGAAVNKPNADIAIDTLHIVKDIQGRGHPVTRLTGDLAYAGLGVEQFLRPLKELGVPLLADFKKTQKGPIDHVHGARQVEGAYYCAATPDNLLNASLDFAEGKIDEATRRRRIDRRNAHFKVRDKEKPDVNGTRTVTCPAHGPGATLECVLRDPHPRSSKKVKPKVTVAPEAPDKVCTQTSISIRPDDGLEYQRALPYGTRDTTLTLRRDRNYMESINEGIQHGPDNIANPNLRRVRGRAAQTFIMIMSVVSWNLRRIARFRRDETRRPKLTYPRRRDSLGLSDYVRKAKNRVAVEKQTEEEFYKARAAEQARKAAAQARRRGGSPPSDDPASDE
jgi:hypothetical protein